MKNPKEAMRLLKRVAMVLQVARTPEDLDRRMRDPQCLDAICDLLDEEGVEDVSPWA